MRDPTSPEPRATPVRWPVTRVRLALLLVLLYAGGTTLRWLHRAAQWPQRPGTDEITANDRRFAPLRPHLPAHGTVGYAGDPPPDGPTALPHFRRYLLAQYALAPLLVVETGEPELVVGNFDSSGTTLPGLELVQDFGDGLQLYRRVAP